MDKPILLNLQGVLKQYAWGSTSADSLVAKVSKSPEGPYAEWWLGAHPSGPARIEGRKPLNVLIYHEPELILGSRVAEKFHNQLPFLFKVLSIGAPLSIQLHPNKILAQKFHARDPKNYPDANHKPEIAIAVSPLEFLYGFRPLKELKQFVRAIPEFSALVSTRTRMLLDSSAKAPARSALVGDLLNAKPADVSRSVRELKARLETDAHSPEEIWAKKLCAQFPETDVGVFFIFVLNLCRLNPGEALFTEPGVPHAYLSGEILECMATSDNVVRAALTEKFRDVSAILESANFEADAPTPVVVSGEGVARYQTPVEEFSIQRISGVAEFSGDEAYGPLLFFVLDGAAELITPDFRNEFEAGSGVLIPAGFGKFKLSCSRGSLYSVNVP